MRLFASFFFFPNALFAQSTLKNGRRRRPVKCVGVCVSSSYSSSRRGREGKGVVQRACVCVCTEEGRRFPEMKFRVTSDTMIP